MTERYEQTSPTDDGGVVTPPRALDVDQDGQPDVKPTWLDRVAPYRKAIVALLAPAVVVICKPLAEGRAPSVADWLAALSAALITGFGVYQTPNAQLG